MVTVRDRAGNSRITGDTIDRGVYEYSATTISGIVDIDPLGRDQIINFWDFAKLAEDWTR